MVRNSSSLLPLTPLILILYLHTAQAWNWPSFSLLTSVIHCNSLSALCLEGRLNASKDKKRKIKTTTKKSYSSTRDPAFSQSNNIRASWMGTLAMISQNVENTDFVLCECGHLVLRPKQKRCISQFPSTAKTKQKKKTLLLELSWKKCCELGNAPFQTEK